MVAPPPPRGKGASDSCIKCCLMSLSAIQIKFHDIPFFMRLTSKSFQNYSLYSSALQKIFEFYQPIIPHNIICNLYDLNSRPNHTHILIFIVQNVSQPKSYFFRQAKLILLESCVISPTRFLQSRHLSSGKSSFYSPKFVLFQSQTLLSQFKSYSVQI